MTVALWIVPALALAGFLLCLSVGPRLGKNFVSAVGVGSIGFATLAAWTRLLPHLRGGGAPVVERLAPWMAAGNFSVDLSFRLDPLSALMVSFVTFVGFLIHVYSIGYMEHDETDAGYARYFAHMNLFMFSMLTLVLANNFLLMFVGWEGVGLCSYLLIGYYYEKEYAAAAGKKAFVVNRIGDFGFLLGLFGVFSLFGTLDFGDVFSRAAAAPGRFAPGLTVVCLLLFLGAMGKSAQVSLHVWLPDAMAGPTPVSALIHAATMVAAGVYLVGRMFAVFAASGHALAFVGTIGSITMLIAALLALVQDDIKRVLAYSTVSQLAYMVAALGLGEQGYTPGLFHLFTHAFFKALLFLGAGSVIHAVHSNNMSEMGGIRKHMPVTFATFAIGSAALAGIPPLAGFWSKDDIISTAWHSGHYGIWIVALLTAILTAFYMTRVVLLTFYGEYRGQAHPHESPGSMTGPLVVLAGLSCVAGFLNATALHIHLFTDWVHFGPVVKAEPFNYGFAAVPNPAPL